MKHIGHIKSLSIYQGVVRIGFMFGLGLAFQDYPWGAVVLAFGAYVFGCLDMYASWVLAERKRTAGDDKNRLPDPRPYEQPCPGWGPYPPTGPMDPHLSQEVQEPAIGDKVVLEEGPDIVRDDRWARFRGQWYEAFPEEEEDQCDGCHIWDDFGHGSRECGIRFCNGTIHKRSKGPYHVPPAS